MVRAAEPVLIPVGAFVASLAVFAGFLALVGAAPRDVFYSIYRGGFGNWYAWQNTLTLAAPLMLTALCTALPARAGLIVIGAEGALVTGGLAAAVTGLALNAAPAWPAILAMAAAGALVGAVWIGGLGALRHYRGVNETIASLLLNYVAIAVLNFLIVGPLRDPESLNHPATYPIVEAHLLGTLGESSIHWGFAVGVAACLLCWFIARRTVFGFAVDVTGGNRRAAGLVGLPVGRLTIGACALGGAAAGLAGMIEVAAVHGRANSALHAGYGYEGILIAFVARHHPIAIVPVAILFGGIRAAGGLMQRDHGLPDATSLVLQGILFVAILASEALYGRLPRWRSEAAA